MSKIYGIGDEEELAEDLQKELPNRIIEELESIKADIKEASYDRLDGFNGGQIVVDWEDIEDMFYERICELKGENK
jgi:hypothetical protein